MSVTRPPRPLKGRITPKNLTAPVFPRRMPPLLDPDAPAQLWLTRADAHSFYLGATSVNRRITKVMVTYRVGNGPATTAQMDRLPACDVWGHTVPHMSPQAAQYRYGFQIFYRIRLSNLQFGPEQRLDLPEAATAPPPPAFMADVSFPGQVAVFFGWTGPIAPYVFDDSVLLSAGGALFVDDSCRAKVIIWNGSQRDVAIARIRVSNAEPGAGLLDPTVQLPLTIPSGTYGSLDLIGYPLGLYPPSMANVILELADGAEFWVQFMMRGGA